MPVLTRRRPGTWRIAITPAALMTWIAGLVLLGSAVLLFNILTAGTADAARSAYTQAHGVRETATVVQVHNTVVESCSGGASDCSDSWSAVVLVRLPQPVGGQAETTVQVPYKVSYQPGDTVSAMVDPQSPGHAELPGVPMTSQGRCPRVHHRPDPDHHRVRNQHVLLRPLVAARPPRPPDVPGDRASLTSEPSKGTRTRGPAACAVGLAASIRTAR